MKQNYIIPSMRLADVHGEELIAASPNSWSDDVISVSLNEGTEVTTSEDVWVKAQDDDGEW